MPRSSTSPERPVRVIRPEIQGLRALAFGLVLIFHIWPEILPGGYIGVDVFFVISGFLIIGQLLAEIDRTGTVGLRGFWARRIRRLLPAATLVLLASLVLAMSVLPIGQWQQNFREIGASAIYLQNWALAADAIDYFAQGTTETLAKHYWSLSIEEQFYLACPILFLLLAIAARRSRHPASTWIGVTLLGVFLLSFAHSAFLTRQAPALAYFSTASRAWEFALGGLLHFLPGRYGARLRVPAIAWLALGAVLACAVAYSGETRFPGLAALVPTVGTAIVIWVGSDTARLSFARFAALRPVRFLGDISYSGYLWHWPLVVVFPVLFLRPPGAVDGLGIATATVVLAALTKILVEDPFRQHAGGVSRPAPAYLAAGATILGLVGASAVGHAYVERQRNAAGLDLAPYRSIDEIRLDLEDTLRARRWPPADQSPGRHAWAPEIEGDGCLDEASVEKHAACRYGDPEGARTMILIGDSWAAHFLPALRQSFGDWNILVRLRGQCPIADVPVRLWTGEERYVDCERHREEVFDFLRVTPHDLVLAADSPVSTISRLISGATGAEALSELKAGTERSYDRLAALSDRVLILESPPRAGCLAANDPSPRLCRTRPDTLEQRVMSEMREEVAREHAIPVLDTTFWFCRGDLVCPQQIGNSLAKADTGHFAAAFTLRWADLLRREIESRIPPEG